MSVDGDSSRVFAAEPRVARVHRAQGARPLDRDRLSFAGSLHYDDAAGHTYQEEFSLDLAGAFEMAQIARPIAGTELAKVVEVLNKIHQSIQEWRDQ